MPGYYAENLSAGKLRRCYEIAPPAVRAYLDAEINFVVSKLRRSDSVLELGCGYGRVLGRLLPSARLVFGIDTSLPSLMAARSERKARLAAMNAVSPGFRNAVFDVVVCIQNAVSAFAVDPCALFREAVRITRPGGLVLFSTYAESFWPERLAWFEIQAAHGLIGEIDYERTGNGVIVCRDGFRATTITPDGFRELAACVGIVPALREVGGSSLFCELTVPRR